MLPDPPSPENQQPLEKTPSSLLETVRRVFPLERWGEYPLILGLSGGSDSVALLRLLLEHRGPSGTSHPLILAHCNYRMRGDESEQDEAFVRQLGEEFQLDCRVWRAETLSKPGGSGWEAYLRDLRYDFFRQVCRESGARYLALAHTADDQAETVAIRLLRGSSLAGLRGIPLQRPLTSESTLLRPLLRIRREELRHYLEHINQPFRSDSSNQSNDFLRNRIRNQLFPLLADNYGTDPTERMLRLAEEAAEFESLLNQLSSGLLEYFDSSQPERLLIDARQLVPHPAPLVRFALVRAWRVLGWAERDLTSRHWRALTNFLRQTTRDCGVINLPEGRVARRFPDGRVLVR